MTAAALGKFAEGFASWRQILASVPSLDAKAAVFSNLAEEAATYVHKGLSKSAAVDELHDIAIAHGLIEARGEDMIQSWISDAFARREHDNAMWPDDQDVRDRSDKARPFNGKDMRGAPAKALPITEFSAMSTTSWKSWVVHHLLGAGETSVWYGEPGSGKSVLAEDLGLHVAAGRTWQGRKVAAGAVLYVALERAGVVARRAIAFGLEQGLAGADLPFAMLRGPLDFRDPRTAESIVATLQELAKRHGCKPALILVDTVSRALCGGDENSPKDMGALVANTARIQAAISVHLAMTHHQPVDGKERMRGHGALLGAVDTTIHITKIGTSRLAEVMKSSDHEEGQRLAFTLKSVTVDQDEHGDRIYAPVVVEADAPAASTTARASLSKATKMALNALREAIDDLGAVPPASNHIPPATKAVTVAEWRDYAYRRGISASDEPRARQTAFQRAVESLRHAHAIGIWEPHVWLS